MASLAHAIQSFQNGGLSHREFLAQIDRELAADEKNNTRRKGKPILRSGPPRSNCKGSEHTAKPKLSPAATNFGTHSASKNAKELTDRAICVTNSPPQSKPPT